MASLQVVLRKAHNSADVEAEVRAKIKEFAARGFRALGLAVADGSTGEARCAAEEHLPVLARLLCNNRCRTWS